MYNKIKIELTERYHQTGKIGFTKPVDDAEAYQLIETLAQVFNNKEEQEQETVINLSDITERLRNFFKEF